MTATDHWVSAALALSLGAVAGRAFRRLRGTTLAAPAAWAIVSALAIAAVEAALGWGAWPEQSLAAVTARYFSAVSTFCPVMAVLGAKRPQDRGWQWIVLSLWIVLMVPAGQAWAAHAATLELSWIWRLLPASLIAVGVLNYLFTRWGFAIGLFALGQFGLSAPLFDALPPDAAFLRSVALAAILAAAVLPPLPASTRSDDSSLRWSRFRDGWGAFWALRVMNRINETADACTWPVRLTWGGFAFTNEHRDVSTLDENVAAQIEQTMDSLLWRFERRGASTRT